jgi:predicted HicB family RNase H-like nuclease
MKNLEYYKNLEYRIIIEHQSFEDESYYICYSEELGKYSCFGQGDTINEAIKSFYIEKDLFIESLYSDNLSIPEPEKTIEGLLSGVFNIRMDPSTHTLLANQAKKNKLSLNQYVNKLIDRNVSIDLFTERISPMFSEMKDLIITHDCNVKQQFKNFWLNIGLKKIAASINDDWPEVYSNEHEYEDLAA